MDLKQIDWSQLWESPLSAKLLKVAVIIFVCWVVFVFLKWGLKKFKVFMSKDEVIRDSGTTLRIKTLAHVFEWLVSIFVFILALYMVLKSFEIDVAPLIAGAGIIGLAVGFGGQYLIRDIINGIFILCEGQYRIRDVVQIGEHGGLVEAVNLRITKLRDLEGRVIYIPNGEVKTVINYTTEYAQALLNIGVAYKENVDHVMSVIVDLGKEMRNDPYFGRLILEDLEMLGVDEFGDSHVGIKFRMKTLPIKQWAVSREFRRRLKNRFDELGIEIPYPHRTLYWGVGQGDMPGAAKDLNPKGTKF